MDRADVLIVGGGFIGSAAAAAFADGRRRVLMLEARPGIDPRFRGELIHPPGAAALASLGILPTLQKEGGVPIRGFAVFDQSRGHTFVLPYDQIPNGRPDGFAMDHREMTASMRRQAADRAGVEVRTGERVVEVLREGGRVCGVRTGSGREFFAPLTLAADGRHSKMRAHLGCGEDVKLLSFTVALKASDVELPHPGYGHVVLGGDGPSLIYPIGEGVVRGCLDFPADEDKGRAAVASILRARYLRCLPEGVRKSFSASIDADDFEMCANHSVYTRHCAVPGAALLGDAGGCSHPLTATGMTNGLNDIHTLVDALANAGRGGTDRALVQYEKRRYRFVRSREILAEALLEVFLGADSGTRALRDGVLAYWSGSSRARAASLALLSGQESRLSRFASEYMRVVALSTRMVLQDPTTPSAAEAVYQMLYHSKKNIRRTLEEAYKEVTRQPVMRA